MLLHVTGLNIAINTKHLIAGKMDGIGRFTYEVFKRLILKHPEVQFDFLFDRPFDKEWNSYNNVNPYVIQPRTIHPILFNYWYNYGVKRHLKRHHSDLFISPDGFLPKEAGIRTITVIHDLNFEHLPDKLPGKITNMYRKNFPIFARQATRIATVSEYSKQDIVKTYGIEADKIDVLFNGGEQFKLKQNETPQGPPYFLYVGSIHPRKNLDRLLLAFDAFKELSKSSHELLLIGKNMWSQTEIKEVHSSLKHSGSVKFLGRLEDDEVAQYLNSAEALVFVSLYEGFGIPVLEAMRLGTPVIASNTTSIPEVAGDAALLVNPEDVLEISDAMNKLVTSSELKNQLVTKGLERSKLFSWDKTADLMWSTILKALE